MAFQKGHTTNVGLKRTEETKQRLREALKKRWEKDGIVRRTETEKYCPRCEKLLPLSEFWLDRKNGKKYFGWCKNCAEKAKTCRIIKKHHELLKDDPERLSTEFLQEIIGVKCLCKRGTA